MIYADIYNVPFPAQVEIVNIELIKLTEFYNINPEKLIQIKDPEFTFVKFFTGEEATDEQGFKRVSMVDDLKMVAICVPVVLIMMVLAIVLYAFKSMRERVSKMVKEAFYDFFFSGMILSINIAFLKLWVAINHQMKESKRKNEPVEISVWSMSGGLLLYIVLVLVLLFKIEHKTIGEFTKKNFESFYKGIKWEKSWLIWYYPVFLLRRVVIIMIPVIFEKQVA